MTEMQDIARGSVAERFWSRVWQCTHRHPCKKCCWPWREVDMENISWATWQTHPTISDKEIASHGMTTARVVLWLTHGPLLLKTLVARHRCDFGPCCNPSPILPGTRKDNVDDQRGKLRTGEGRHDVYLPDGRILSPRDFLTKRTRAPLVPVERQSVEAPPGWKRDAEIDYARLGRRVAAQRTMLKMTQTVVAE